MTLTRTNITIYSYPDNRAVAIITDFSNVIPEDAGNFDVIVLNGLASYELHFIRTLPGEVIDYLRGYDSKIVMRKSRSHSGFLMLTVEMWLEVTLDKCLV